MTTDDKPITLNSWFGPHSGHEAVMLTQTGSVLPFYCVTCNRVLGLRNFPEVVEGAAPEFCHQVDALCPRCGVPVWRWNIFEASFCSDCQEDWKEDADYGRKIPLGVFVKTRSSHDHR